MMGKYIRYKVRDGAVASIWHDKWNSEVSLSTLISKKDIFYAGFNDQATVAVLIAKNGWIWPSQW